MEASAELTHTEICTQRSNTNHRRQPAPLRGPKLSTWPGNILRCSTCTCAHLFSTLQAAAAFMAWNLWLAWQHAAVQRLQQMMCSPVLCTAGSCHLYHLEACGPARQHPVVQHLQQVLCSPVLHPAGSCCLYGAEACGGAGASTDGAQPGVLVAAHVQAERGAWGLGAHPYGPLGLPHHRGGQGQLPTSPAAVLAVAHLQCGSVLCGQQMLACNACASRCLLGQGSQLSGAFVFLRNICSLEPPVWCK